MYYGYEPTTKDNLLLKELSVGLKLPVGYVPGNTPYLERAGLYVGIRIRRLTHLPETQLQELIDKADKIHKRIVG